jgi:hypothetical protein
MPTHSIFCTFTLLKDKGNPRCLFNLYLHLEDIPKPVLRDWVAGEITKKLKRSLMLAKEPCFIIRCNQIREYPWCLEHDEVDEYWISESGAYTRLILKDLAQAQKIG